MSKPKSTKDIEIPNNLLKDLLTESETRMVKQRLIIINLLEEGLSIRAISKEAKVGTDTVVRISKMLDAKPQIKQFLKQAPISATSKWVFGESREE